MSRIGKQLITLPAGVTVDLQKDKITVKGPKGELFRSVPSMIHLSLADNAITVDVVNKEDKKERSMWGTYSAHIQNMVNGVTVGIKKQLEINGVGYKVALQGKDLKLEVGFSHSVIFPAPEGITFAVEKNLMTITGIDKELVGKTAAEIRQTKKPEPYKGKGIKYIDEIIRRKAGKAAKSA